MPLDVKVVLTGDRYIYYILQHYDPEFSTLFKVAADMSEEVSRSAESTLLFSRMIRTLQEKEKLLPLDSGGAAVDVAAADVTATVTDADLFREPIERALAAGIPVVGYNAGQGPIEDDIAYLTVGGREVAIEEPVETTTTTAPAPTTTTIPARQACSTAKESGSSCAD